LNRAIKTIIAGARGPALVFLIPFIVYLPTLWGTFYYDDNVIFFGHQVKRLAENPFLLFKGGAGLEGVPGAPRSLHVFLLLMVYKFFGPSPLPYHLLNLLAHSATALMVFLLLRSLTENRALALTGGLIFGLHPVHVENITFVTLGGTDLFYTLWALLSLLLYIRFRGARPPAISGARPPTTLKALPLLGFSIIAFYFSLLSKESAVAMVVLFPLTEMLLGRKGYLWALPHLALVLYMKWGLIFSVAGIVSTAGSEGAVQIAGEASGPGEIILNLGFFVKSLLLPYPLSPFIKEFGMKTALYLLAVLPVAVAVLGVVLRKRLVVFGSLWFLFASAPYLVVPLLETNVAITAERYIYGPSAGACILLAYGLVNLKKLSRPVVAVILAAYSIIGVDYFYKAWRTEEAFWRYSVKMNPDYVSGYTSLAGIELGRGNVGGAKAIIHEALGRPKGMPAEFAQAAYILADIARQEGAGTMAEGYYLLSLRYAPYEFSFIDLGYLYLNAGMPERAKWAFEGAMRFPHQNMRAVFGLAKSYELMGLLDAARSYAMRVVNEARDPVLRAAAAEILTAK